MVDIDQGNFKKTIPKLMDEFHNQPQEYEFCSYLLLKFVTKLECNIETGPDQKEETISK